ncbi:MAG: DUF4118 domain-containing protein [Christensenellaceae bacterium]
MFLLDYFKINDLTFNHLYSRNFARCSITRGYAYSVLSVVSVLGYNFFYRPALTLKIDDSKYLVTFFLMIAVGLE